jgi:bifunctional non-homologous end joining protein LigD
MSLQDYKEKRDFDNTSEPPAVERPSGAHLIFVVQEHHARRLHYDFRLEMGGVLKSWAVPKGPSMNPKDKRLAIMVEDHPLDYADFEGIIPEGNYGAGEVKIWDNGEYEPVEEEADPEAALLRNLETGRLSIAMKGRKLKGLFSLVKLKGREENSWLLIKGKDEFAAETD